MDSSLTLEKFNENIIEELEKIKFKPLKYLITNGVMLVIVIVEIPLNIYNYLKRLNN